MSERSLFKTRRLCPVSAQPCLILPIDAPDGLSAGPRFGVTKSSLTRRCGRLS